MYLQCTECDLEECNFTIKKAGIFYTIKHYSTWFILYKFPMCDRFDKINKLSPQISVYNGVCVWDLALRIQVTKHKYHFTISMIYDLTQNVNKCYIQERNHINALFARNPSEIKVTLTYIRGFILERNHINAVFVMKSS